MTTLLVLGLFVLMVGAPCFVALRSSRNTEMDEAEEMEFSDPSPARTLASQSYSPELMTLQEEAAFAESNAIIAQELAKQAHWNALAAVARAAALRADAAEEAAWVAGQAAQNAARAMEQQFELDHLSESPPSLDLPRSRVDGRRAA